MDERTYIGVKNVSQFDEKKNEMKSEVKYIENPNLNIVEMRNHILISLNLIADSFPAFAVKKAVPELFVITDYFEHDPCGVLYFYRRKTRSNNRWENLHVLYQKIYRALTNDKSLPKHNLDRLKKSDIELIKEFLEIPTLLLDIKAIQRSNSALNGQKLGNYTLEYYIEIHDRTKYYKP